MKPQDEATTVVSNQTMQLFLKMTINTAANVDNDRINTIDKSRLFKEATSKAPTIGNTAMSKPEAEMIKSKWRLLQKLLYKALAKNSTAKIAALRVALF